MVGLIAQNYKILFRQAFRSHPLCLDFFFYRDQIMLKHKNANWVYNKFCCSLYVREVAKVFYNIKSYKFPSFFLARTDYCHVKGKGKEKTVPAKINEKSLRMPVNINKSAIVHFTQHFRKTLYGNPDILESVTIFLTLTLVGRLTMYPY